MDALMDTLSALLVRHLRVELSPRSMVAGVAVKLLIVGAGFVPLTVTVTVALTDFVELAAVSVYVVVLEGDTRRGRTL